MGIVSGGQMIPREWETPRSWVDEAPTLRPREGPVVSWCLGGEIFGLSPFGTPGRVGGLRRTSA